MVRHHIPLLLLFLLVTAFLLDIFLALDLLRTIQNFSVNIINWFLRCYIFHVFKNIQSFSPLFLKSLFLNDIRLNNFLLFHTLSSFFKLMLALLNLYLHVHNRVHQLIISFTFMEMNFNPSNFLLILLHLLLLRLHYPLRIKQIFNNRNILTIITQCGVVLHN